jgi:hypothetical protein
MTLKDLSLADRKKLTSHYPLLLVGESGGGKTYAFSQLDKEEAKRTVVFNFDNKSICEGEDDEEFFGKVYKNYNYENIEMVEDLCADIISIIAYEKCDRVLFDTATELESLLNRWAIYHFANFPYGEKNNALYKILTAIKSATFTYGKFVYITAHYPPKIGSGSTVKRYVTIKGNEYKNAIEKDFNTIVESYMSQEHRQFFFRADVFDQTDTTKTKLSEGHFKFARISVDDLEQVLTKRKTVVDGKLVEV